MKLEEGLIVRGDVLYMLACWKEEQPEAEWLNEVCDDVESLPSARCDIVRCRNCKWWHETGFASKLVPTSRKCSMLDAYMQANSFCSYAERRTDD